MPTGGTFMAKQTEIRILVVDDHRLFREGIATVIKAQDDMLVVAEAANGPEALERYREHQPDVTLMDMRLRDSSGLDAMIAIRKRFPEARVILVSTFEGDLEIASALQAGAAGHILKTMHPREIVGTIRQVYANEKCASLPSTDHTSQSAGDKCVTSGEGELLVHLAIENQNRGIGQRLLISENPVKKHFKQMMQKLDARRQTSALNITAQGGFIRS